ncbi:MgtC/SapB family protein [Methyloglobulus sp.]|uniref:MgtC/SapB family protein n=1 Tax=Methyloglobulus sp. TaxID=2518622 RepID=UPI0032B73E6D
MIELQNFKLLGIALAIGLLIGLERGWHTRDKGEGMRIAGLRTHGLIALLGGLWGILAVQTGILLMGFAFLSLTAVLLIAYSKSLNKFEDYSITSIIASLITFTLGALTAFGHTMLASATAVVITLLLGFKPLLHGWVNKLEQRELEATLKLLLISVVMLPILPNRSFDPWDVFNPYHIWLLVVLIAGVAYLGYFAIKIGGNRHGPVLTGIFGGLGSSTAVTLNLSRLSKTYPGMQNALSAGILTACATLFVRTLLLSSALNPALFRELFPPLSIMGVLTYLLAFLLWRTAREFQGQQEVMLDNPFQLRMALKFGAFLVAVLFLSKLLKIYFGDTSTYLLAAASGIADVDPITISMSQMSKDGLELSVAARAILIAVAVNSAVKSVIASVIGDRNLGLRVGAVLAIAVVAGLMFS